MKYIRTKDGIYEVITTDCGWEIAVYANNDFGEKYIQEDDVIKQANTIEELVDVYILKDTETGYCGVMYKETMKHSINPGTAYGREFYGAIWAIDEKGIPTLKPVAKMNEKGELELL